MKQVGLLLKVRFKLKNDAPYNTFIRVDWQIWPMAMDVNGITLYELKEFIDEMNKCINNLLISHMQTHSYREFPAYFPICSRINTTNFVFWFRLSLSIDDDR